MRFSNPGMFKPIEFPVRALETEIFHQAVKIFSTFYTNTVLN